MRTPTFRTHSRQACRLFTRQLLLLPLLLVLLGGMAIASVTIIAEDLPGPILPPIQVDDLPGIPFIPPTSAGPTITSKTPAAGVKYLLEEATDAAFATGLRTAYSGPNLQKLITGRLAGTTYYYRVKAVKGGLVDSPRTVAGNGCQVGP